MDGCDMSKCIDLRCRLSVRCWHLKSHTQAFFPFKFPYEALKVKQIISPSNDCLLAIFIYFNDVGFYDSTGFTVEFIKHFDLQSKNLSHVFYV